MSPGESGVPLCRINPEGDATTLVPPKSAATTGVAFISAEEIKICFQGVKKQADTHDKL
jgi:hypothetical protein